MKIFGFYITRINWYARFQIRESRLTEREMHIARLEIKIESLYLRLNRPRDEKGQFMSKRKQTHDQLRAEQAYTVDWVKLREGL